MQPISQMTSVHCTALGHSPDKVGNLFIDACSALHICIPKKMLIVTRAMFAVQSNFHQQDLQQCKQLCVVLNC